MRHDSEIQLNNSVSLLISMFCSHDQVFKKYWKKLLHGNYLMFFLVCRNCEIKEKCYQAHVMNLLLFFILESVSMIIVLICYKNMTVFSKRVSNFLFVQEILYMVMLDYFLRYITSVSKSGQRLVLCMTVAYFHDVNLRTNYFSIILLCLYALETRLLRYNIGKLWET